MYNNNENDQICGGVAAVAEICDKYGFPFNEADLEYNEGTNEWNFTPFDNGGGITVTSTGDWYLINFDNGNIRLLDFNRDLDMFDEIAKALSKDIYEFLFQNSDPDNVRYMLENGDEEEAIDALNYEMGCILCDLQNKDDYWFPYSEVETAKEALQAFYSIIQEYDLDDKVDDWFFSQECQEVALL